MRKKQSCLWTLQPVLWNWNLAEQVRLSSCAAKGFSTPAFRRILRFLPFLVNRMLRKYNSDQTAIFRAPRYPKSSPPTSPEQVGSSPPLLWSNLMTFVR